MKKFHMIYTDNYKVMLDSIKLLFDNQEYELNIIEPLLKEVEGNFHHIVIKGKKYKDKDIELEDGKVQYDSNFEEIVLCDTGINMIEDEEYYVFKFPLFSFLKGDIVKVTGKVERRYDEYQIICKSIEKLNE